MTRGLWLSAALLWASCAAAAALVLAGFALPWQIALVWFAAPAALQGALVYARKNITILQELCDSQDLLIKRQTELIDSLWGAR